jgi:hypothetical protein
MPFLGLFFACWLASLFVGSVIYWSLTVLVCWVRRAPRKYSDTGAFWGAVYGSVPASIVAGTIGFRIGGRSSGMVDWLADPMVGVLAGGLVGAVVGGWIVDAWSQSHARPKE